MVILFIMLVLALALLPHIAAAESTKAGFLLDDACYLKDGVVCSYTAGDVEAAIDSGRVLVPLRTAGEALGATVSWNPTERTAVLTRGSTVVEVPVPAARPVGYGEIRVNGSLVKIDVSPDIVQDRIVVPLRALTEAFQLSIIWDAPSRSAWVGYDALPDIAQVMKQVRGTQVTPPDLDPYRARMVEILRRYVKGGPLDSTSFYFKNPVGLIASEVEKYAATYDDTDLTSFRVMNDALGRPAYFVRAGGSWGLSQWGIEVWAQTNDLLNRIDPSFIRSAADEHGLECVSIGVLGHSPFNSPDLTTANGSYESLAVGKLVFFNERYNQTVEQALSSDIQRLYSRRRAIMHALLAESEGLRVMKYRDYQAVGWKLTNLDRLSDYEGSHKTMTAIKTVEAWLTGAKISEPAARYLSEDLRRALAGFVDKEANFGK